MKMSKSFVNEQAFISNYATLPFPSIKSMGNQKGPLLFNPLYFLLPCTYSSHASSCYITFTGPEDATAVHEYILSTFVSSLLCTDMV